MKTVTERLLWGYIGRNYRRIRYICRGHGKVVVRDVAVWRSREAIELDSVRVATMWEPLLACCCTYILKDIYTETVNATKPRGS